MVVPAFGFSVGDFVTAIQVISRAAAALSNTSGATQQFKQTAIELYSLERVFRRVEALQPRGQNADTVEEIRMWSLACHVPLANFIPKVRRFENALSGGASSSRGLRTAIDAVRKVEWAVKIEKEVANLKAKIAPQLTGIGLLLDLEAIKRGAGMQDSLDRSIFLANQLHAQSGALRTLVVSELAGRQQVDILTDLMNDSTSQNKARYINMLRTSMDTHASMIRMEADMDRRFSDLEATMKRAAPQGPQDASGSTREPSPRAATVDSVLRALRQAVPNVQTTAAQASVCLAHMISTIRLHLTHALLAFLAVMVGRACQMIVCIMALPSTFLSTDIRLEDALGRVYRLQYEHFRYWPMMERRLELAFSGFPGEKQIRSGRFQLESASPIGRTESRQVISWQDWERKVAPGNRVLMFIMVKRYVPLRDSCPRCQRHSECASASRSITCVSCGLVYRNAAAVERLTQDDKSRFSMSGLPYGMLNKAATGDEEVYGSARQNIALNHAPREQSKASRTPRAAWKVNHQATKDYGLSAGLAAFKRVVTAGEELELGEVIQYYGPANLLPWYLRDAWAKQIIKQLSAIHEGGSVHRDITLATVRIDANNDAWLTQIGVKDRPSSGWESPELSRLITGGHAPQNYVGVRSDLYQLGMVLWALAEVEHHPERTERPLPPVNDGAPYNFRQIVERCLSPRPQHREDAKYLLRHSMRSMK